jgi:hypothetical protein
MTTTEFGHVTMDGYLQALATRGAFADFFTDDVTLDMIGAGQSAQGRAQVEGFIRFAHEQAFDGRPELKSLIVDPDGRRSAIEVDFVGRHTAEFLAYRQPAAMSGSLTAFTTTSLTAASRPYVSTV